MSSISMGRSTVRWPLRVKRGSLLQPLRLVKEASLGAGTRETTENHEPHLVISRWAACRRFTTMNHVWRAIFTCRSVPATQSSARSGIVGNADRFLQKGDAHVD